MTTIFKLSDRHHNTSSLNTSAMYPQKTHSGCTKSNKMKYQFLFSWALWNVSPAVFHC